MYTIVDIMAMNLNKQIKKIRESLENKKYKKDIPLEFFKKELMILYGMRRKKVNEWTVNYEFLGFITIKEGFVNFVK